MIAGWALVVERPFDRSPAATLLCGDASAGRVETAAGDGRVVAVEGRLDSGDEIARRSGFERTDRAAELLAHAHARLGDDVFTAATGAFAAVVWIPGERRGVLVRDPIGVVPLYYAVLDDAVVAATTWRAALATGLLSGDVDPVALAARIAEFRVPAETTPLAGLKRVPPAHVLSVGPRGAELRRYWRPDPASAPSEDVNEAREQFASLVERAVRRCSGSARVGIFLSGGIDSAVVTAAASEGGCDAELFSVAFPEPASEVERQREIARRLGLCHVVRPLEAGIPVLSATLERARGSGVPPLGPWDSAYGALARDARERGATTLLTGEGGDEWLEPDSTFAVDRLAAGDFVELAAYCRARARAASRDDRLAPLRVFARAAAVPAGKELAALLAGRVAPGRLVAVRRARLAARLPPWLAPSAELRGALLDLAVSALDPLDPRRAYARSRDNMLASPGVEAMLETQYAVDGERGVRTMHPLLDPDLVAYLYHAPPSLLGLRGEARGLAVDYVERRIPGWRPPARKVAADPVLVRAFSAARQSLHESLGRAPVVATIGLVDEAGFRAGIDDAVARADVPALFRIWHVVGVETWLRGVFTANSEPTRLRALWPQEGG